MAAAFGDPLGKAEALRQVIVCSGVQVREIVFFGDSLTDRDAAMELGVRFIAVIREKNDFIEVNCPKIVDFQDWDALCNAALCA